MNIFAVSNDKKLARKNKELKLLKSERIALKKIINATWNNPLPNGKQRNTKLMCNDDFIQKGLSRRDFVNNATNSLVQKGLIFKVKSDDHYFMYTPNKRAVHVFKELDLLK